MRISEVRELNDTELDKELSDQERALMNLRFRKATLQLTNTNELANTRKTIARVKTVIRERKITSDLATTEAATKTAKKTEGK
jgi:large subunit ribosomal protein L29